MGRVNLPPPPAYLNSYDAATPMFSRSRNSTKLVTILCDASESQKSKIVVQKQKYLHLLVNKSIYLSQPVHNVALRFQRLYLCFQGSGVQWSYSSYFVMHVEVRNPRQRLTKKKKILISQHICTIYFYLFHFKTLSKFSSYKQYTIFDASKTIKTERETNHKSR